MTNFTISRRSLLGGLTAGSALALAGCNSSPDSTSSASPSAGAVVGSDKLTVYAWTNGPVIDANFTKSVEAFNKKFSGKFTAEINFLPYDQYWQKIQLQYAAGEPFDMYYWDVQAYAHYKSGLLQNNQDVVKAAGLEDAAAFPTALWDPWRFDGTNMYGIPENVQSVSFFYNKTHFDEAKLPYPDPSWTWDKVAEVAPLLTKTTHASTGVRP